MKGIGVKLKNRRISVFTEKDGGKLIKITRLSDDKNLDPIGAKETTAVVKKNGRIVTTVLRLTNEAAFALAGCIYESERPEK